MNFYYSMTEHPLNMTNLWFGNYFRILHFSTDFNSCMSVEQDHNENSTKNRCNNCGVAEDSWESLGLQGDQTNLKRKSVLNIHWTDVEAEAPILWPPDVKNWLTGNDPDAGRLKAGGKGMTEDEMVGWHHQLDEHEIEQALGDGDGQGGLVWCSPWGHRVRHD